MFINQFIKDIFIYVFFLIRERAGGSKTESTFFLWYLANQESICETASVVGLSESTTYYAIKHTGEVMCSVMDDASIIEIVVNMHINGYLYVVYEVRYTIF